jgi:hypothetical protein
LAGQAIGSSIIIDCSRYLNKIIEINPNTYQAVVQPGVILNSLNKACAPFGLQFGPDPASAERASIGGSIANNATGAHSIIYGMTADHLLEAAVVMADGNTVNIGTVSLQASLNGNSSDSSFNRLYSTALRLRRVLRDIKTTRPAPGGVFLVGLNYDPWSSQPLLWENLHPVENYLKNTYPPVRRICLIWHLFWLGLSTRE